MAFDLNISTTLYNTIEGNRKYLPLKTYQLATRIAGELVRILDHRDIIILPPEYEHLLKTMSLNDIPELFNKFNSIPDRDRELTEKAAESLHRQLETIYAKVSEIKDDYTRDMAVALDANSHFIDSKYALKPKNTGSNEGVDLKGKRSTGPVTAGSMPDILGELSAKKPVKKKSWWK